MRYALWLLLLVACDDGAEAGSFPGDSPGGGLSGGQPGGEPGGEPGRLTAGEWSDAENWDFWLGLYDRAEGTPGPALAAFGLAAEQRFLVEIQGDDGPAVDVAVELLDGREAVVAQARTDVEGQAHLVPGLAGRATGPFRVRVVGGEAAPAEADEVVRLQASGAPPPEGLDVMFLVDTTGSMCDELAFLQTELADVMDRVAAGRVAVRTAVGVYRDDGDEYVVRPFPFRSEGVEAAADLQAQGCGGGGDFPEAVDQALAAGLEAAWSERARARVLFLVLDAPPHETSSATGRLQAAIRQAQAKGVRVVPVVGSGIDRATEFLMRGLALLTGGTYAFLTDHSGIGDPHLEPTVGPYEVERLNDLLVRLLLEAAG